MPKEKRKLPCDVCKVVMFSERAMADHVKGRKHQRAIESLNKRRRLASTSIYVCDLPMSATNEQIETFFFGFGAIASFYIDGRARKFAIVEYKNEKAVDSIMSKLPLKMNGHEIKVKRREVEEKEQKEAQYKQQLERQREEQEKKEEQRHGRLLEELLNSTSVDHQVKRLVSHIGLSDDQLNKRQQILNSLQDTLTHYIPGCTVHMFGSTVNGLGVYGCDMDVCVDLHLDEPHLHQCLQPNTQPPIFTTDLPLLRMENGHVTVDSLKLLNTSQQLKVVSRILKVARDNKFKSILVIQSARCPVIKTLYPSRQLSVDITTGNRLALRNTHYIRTMVSLDKRIRPLVFAVRFWAKRQGFGGTGKNAGHMSNYALTMLVFNYLTQTTPPVLPTVTNLAGAAEYRVLIDDWDCSFSEDSSVITLLPNNTNSLTQLLSGFFEFYSKLDFSQVIVLRDSTTVAKEQFKEQLETSPMCAKFKITPISIQDPFVLNHNITQNISENLAAKIQAELKTAWDKCKAECFTQSERELWGLSLLCDTKKWKKVDDFSFVVRLMVEDDSLEQRRLDVVDLIQRILHDILFMQVRVKKYEANDGRTHEDNGGSCHGDDNEQPTKKQRLDAKLSVTLACTSVYRFWTGRQKACDEMIAALDTPGDLLGSCFDVQEGISRHLEKSGDSGPFETPVLDFDLNIRDFESGLKLSMFSQLDTEDFKSFYYFFTDYLLNIVQNYLRISVVVNTDI